MLKLYWSPGACSLSPHIALREGGLEFTPVRVDIRAKKLEDGSDFLALNPKGYVPALGLESGQVLTEGVAIVQYIADHAPTKIAPAALDPARYVLQEWLTYINSELHKNVSVLFSGAPEAWKETVNKTIEKRLALPEAELAKHPYLMGEDYTVADGYLFWILRTWPKMSGRTLTPNLQAFHDRMAARPHVQEALRSEGFKV